MVGIKYALRNKLAQNPFKLFTNKANKNATVIPTGTVMDTYLMIFVNESTKSLDLIKLA